MSKRKHARSAKAQSASKVRAKAARRQPVQHHRTRANSKQARVLALLHGPNGVVRDDGLALRWAAAERTTDQRAEAGLFVRPSNANRVPL